MRTLKLASVVGAVLLIGSLIGFAQAGSDRSRTTGGGQVLNEDQVQGAGDTIAWTIQDEAAPKGQVQWVDRTGDGTGQGQVVRHGTPTCLMVEGNAAQAEVLWNDGTESSLFIVDNGEGSAAAADTVTIAPVGDEGCSDDSPDEETGLSRGNAQVYDAG